MSTSRLQLLQDMPVFGGINDNVLNLLLELAPVVHVAKGEFFFREGEQALSMFVLEMGKVAIYKTYKGRQRLLRYLNTGDCFGEMALIDLFPRSASVMAQQDCQAIELSSATLYEIYKKDLEQFTLIHMNIARELSRRLRTADDRLFRIMAETEAIHDYQFIFT